MPLLEAANITERQSLLKTASTAEETDGCDAHEFTVSAHPYADDTHEEAYRRLLEQQVQRLAAKLGELEPELRHSETDRHVDQANGESVSDKAAAELVLHELDVQEELAALSHDLQTLDSELALDQIDPGDAEGA